MHHINNAVCVLTYKPGWKCLLVGSILQMIATLLKLLLVVGLFLEVKTGYRGFETNPLFRMPVNVQ